MAMLKHLHTADPAVAEPSLAATGETPEVADSAGNQSGPESQTLLQDLLPDITQLAQRAGCLRQLAEIIDTLRHAKEA
jgi:hypothetical protein